jgi:acyl-CoA synthetase (AMP-forming)/AMP-acid ligase II
VKITDVGSQPRRFLAVVRVLRCAVRTFANGKLAHYKIPRYVHIVDEFPMTVTGKVRKVEMRENRQDRRP